MITDHLKKFRTIIALFRMPCLLKFNRLQMGNLQIGESFF